MDPLRDLLRSRTPRSIEAPYPISELGIRAGDTLDYDPGEPDVIIHARTIPRAFLDAALEIRDQELRRKFTEAARIFGKGEKAPASGAGQRRRKVPLQLVR